MSGHSFWKDLVIVDALVYYGTLQLTGLAKTRVENT
jgi:hypothetical protein